RGSTSSAPLALGAFWIRGGSSPEPSRPAVGGGGGVTRSSSGASSNSASLSSPSKTLSSASTTSNIPGDTFTTFDNSGSAQITSIPTPDNRQGSAGGGAMGGNSSP
ncbi:hypothetical protein CVT24_008281, partial [Panaeolus cyanescens]